MQSRNVSIHAVTGVWQLFQGFASHVLLRGHACHLLLLRLEPSHLEGPSGGGSLDSSGAFLVQVQFGAVKGMQVEVIVAVGFCLNHLAFTGSVFNSLVLAYG